MVIFCIFTAFPLSISFFFAAFLGGKLEMFRLVWYQMLFVMLIIQAKPGDRRNWPVIKGWAENLKQVLI